MIHHSQTLIFQDTLRGWTVGFRAILNKRKVFEVCTELYMSIVKARALAQYSESEEIRVI